MSDQNAKPDYIDIDGDGNTDEPMKKAAKAQEFKDNKMNEVMSKRRG